LKVFVICHTHWDREWFLTSEYTNEWLSRLFENLLDLTRKKKDFIFVLDGQTLILEDLFSIRPDLRDDVFKLVEEGKFIIGPVYAQIDWRISSEYSIWKNFSIGMRDIEKYHARKFCGWFMDNFGQISQIPQILRIFGLDCVFVWRGVKMEEGKERMILEWESPDGSRVLTIFLIAGYRNLYNLSETKKIARKRFDHEVNKVQNFTDIPLLLDGYDLDIHPEDPRDFLDVSISPFEYLKEVKKENATKITGEMISGKYASTFPGTLSTRTYLKVGADHVGRLLQYLSIFDQDDEESWREYLKTLIHDNICGVGVDQIHEKMEKIYLKLHGKLLKNLEEVFSSFDLSGIYAFIPSSYRFNLTLAEEKGSFEFESEGAGIWKVKNFYPWRKGKSSDFRNRYYEFHFDGKEFFMDGIKIGSMKILKDEGDTYSSFTTPTEYEEKIHLREIRENEYSKSVIVERKIASETAKVKTIERIYLDSSPFIRWDAEILPEGVGYKLVFGCPDATGKVLAGMPYDVVERESIDRDLFPENVEGILSSVLLAARETGEVKEFPFQNFVSRGDITILARGLREYIAEDGLWVTLLRAVEWITKKVKGRVGDAGPEMYVPGARCQRRLKLNLGFMKSSEEFEKWVDLFSKPVIFFESHGKNVENIPLFFLDKRWVLKEKGEIVYIDNKKIKRMKADSVTLKKEKVKIYILSDMEFPFGPDLYAPDEDIIRKMEKDIEKMKKEIDKLENEVERLEGVEKHRKIHRILSLERSILEKRLSILLNEERLGKEKTEEIKKVGEELNEARRKRRTYDYILEMYEADEEAKP